MQKILNSVVVREGNKFLAFHFTYTCTHTVLQYIFFLPLSQLLKENTYVWRENGYDVFSECIQL